MQAQSEHLPSAVSSLTLFYTVAYLFWLPSDLDATLFDILLLSSSSVSRTKSGIVQLPWQAEGHIAVKMTQDWLFLLPKKYRLEGIFRLVCRLLTGDCKKSVSGSGNSYGLPELTVVPSVSIVGWTKWSTSDRSCPLHNLNNVKALTYPSILWQPVQALLLDLIAM